MLRTSTQMPNSCRALPIEKSRDASDGALSPADFTRLVIATALSVKSADDLSRWIVDELRRVLPYEDAHVVRTGRALEVEVANAPERHLVGRLIARDVEIASIHLLRGPRSAPFGEAE